MAADAESAARLDEFYRALGFQERLAFDRLSDKPDEPPAYWVFSVDEEQNEISMQRFPSESQLRAHVIDSALPTKKDYLFFGWFLPVTEPAGNNALRFVRLPNGVLRPLFSLPDEVQIGPTSYFSPPPTVLLLETQTGREAAGRRGAGTAAEEPIDDDEEAGEVEEASELSDEQDSGDDDGDYETV